MSLPWTVYERMPRRLPLSLGFSRYALNFDGVDDCVVKSDGVNLDGYTAISLEAWFKSPAMPTSSKWILGRQFSYGILVSTTTVDFPIATSNNAWGSHSFSSTFNSGVWYQLVGVYDGSKLEVFINGISIGTVAGVSGGIVHDASFPAFFISGNANAGGAGGLNGIIDEVRIYNRTLSLVEIRRNMMEYHNPTRSGLVLWLRMEEGSGLTAHDGSGQGNDGSLLPAAGPPVWTRLRKWELRSNIGV